jgi:PAS domain S-box-containing protein
MSNLVGSITASPTEGAAQFFKPPRLLVSWVALIVVLWLAVAAWLYIGLNTSGELTPVQTTQSDSAQLEGLSGQLRHPVLITAASGIVVWLATVLGVNRWRRNLQHQWRVTKEKLAGEVEAVQQQLVTSREAAEKRAGEVEVLQQRLATEQQRLAAERRKAERLLRQAELQLQDRVTDLTRKIVTLESELDQRKKYEKNLSDQRLSLESSKTVLELHVQERTLAVQQLQQRQELILNCAGDGICGLDMNGRVAFVNPAVARLTGWSHEELIGKTESEVFHGNNPMPSATLAGSSESPVFYRKDGSRFPVELVRTPIEEGGRKTGEVLIFKDITERKRAAATLAQKMAELSRSNDELEQFAFVASHDLQEPLRKIQAFGDRLKTKCNGLLPPETLDYLDRMQGASARMRTLIDDLLTFSRVIRNSQPFASVGLGQVAREVLADLEVRIERSGGRVEVGELPCIEADATQMRQLLLNLIGNALKFQPPGGHPVVKVSARTFASIAGEQYCELAVEDNGIGFEEQYAEKIFAVFQRLHGRGEYEGTGVGLAICRRITDRHQGSIVAKGQPGKGATFIVTLPVHQSAPRPAV